MDGKGRENYKFAVFFLSLREGKNLFSVEKLTSDKAVACKGIRKMNIKLFKLFNYHVRTVAHPVEQDGETV